MNKRVAKNEETTQIGREPIFIHSLWRAGSTYLFSVFRRSSAGYWCYQEPVHEFALASKDNPEKLLTLAGETMLSLRHPQLSEPYFLELYETSKYWRDLISKPIIFEQYFGSNGSEGLTKYLDALISHAKGRPVIQECHTSCRIAEIKDVLGGTHIYLWRNPWDQWWSYKTTNHFDITCQLILNTQTHPSVIDRLRSEVGFQEFHDSDITKELAHFDLSRLSADHSYLVFYTLWVLGLLEGMQHADLLLNIDSLSTEQACKDNVTAHLKQLGISGVDFSDCKVPQTYFDQKDKNFFLEQEEKAHALLILSGYTNTQLTNISVLRQANKPKILAVPVEEIPLNLILSDAIRARELVIRTESEKSALSHSQKTREQQLANEIASYRTKIINIQSDALSREKALSSLAQQTLEKARTESQAHLKELIEREKEHSRIMQAHILAMQEAGQNWAQRENELELTLEQFRTEVHTHQLNAHRLDGLLNAKHQENEWIKQTFAAFEAQLRLEIQQGKDAQQHLYQLLAAEKIRLDETHATLSWRMTKPLRTFAAFISPSKNKAVAPTGISTASTTLEEIRQAETSNASESTTPQQVQNKSVEAYMQSTNYSNFSAVTTIQQLLDIQGIAFIRAAYQKLLNREPDSEGMRYYLGRLEAGTSKLQVVTQLRRSKEGRIRAVSLAGLDATIKRHQRGQYPLIGWLIRFIEGTEGNKPSERKLRAIEFQIQMMGEKNRRRFDQMDNALKQLHQRSATNAALNGVDISELTISSLQADEIFEPDYLVEPEGLKDLSEKARNMYFQLKAANSQNATWGK